jgi:Spy/CpxP family protein refolding chaperone
MKKTFFIAAALMILSLAGSSLFAQGMGMSGKGCGGPGMGMGMGMGMHKPFQHLEMMQYQFDLTNAQVDKLYKIDKEYMDKFHQNRNDADKIKDLRDKHRAEVDSILTAEQKVKWNDFIKNHPMNGKRMQGKGRMNDNCPAFGPMGGMHGQHIGMMQKDLGLSNDQLDKIYKIHRDNMDKFYQNRNDADKVRELRTKQDAEIEKVLTPEQITKWNETKNNRPMYNKKPQDGKGGKKHHGMY